MTQWMNNYKQLQATNEIKTNQNKPKNSGGGGVWTHYKSPISI